MQRVAHLTSVHPRYDTRIFVKQCRSLAANGYSVTLVVADGKGDELADAVNIVDVGLRPGRWNRMLRVPRLVFRQAVALNADIYHFHDPELIPVGLRLKLLGKRVIFDAHEDVPKQLLGKPYLGPIRLRVLAALFSLFERLTCRWIDAIVTATPSIRDKYLAINRNTVDVNNFPLLDELDAGVPWENKRSEICYVGGISATRGILEVVAALHELDSTVRLNLVGNYWEPETEAALKALPGWQLVNEMGFLDREGVREVLGRSIAGLVTFMPLPNHVDAQPNKMFEYMSAGLPVIASDFALWREIIEDGECGICVDPRDAAAIAEAIEALLADRQEARRLGENGRAAVLKRYNWSIEENKLLSLYASLLASSR